MIARFLLPTALAVGVPLAAAADPAVGRQKAQACIVCHGPLGKSATPDAPNLAGQPEGYLVSQLMAFRGGSRQHQVMSVVAKSLTNDDIHDLAAWFASIALEVRAP